MKEQTGGRECAEAIFSYDFGDGLDGWAGGFADLPAGEEEFYELFFGHLPLPAYLSENRKAVIISGNNHSDDLFMFIKRRLGGLKPDTAYGVRFEIQVATNAPTGCVGVGGRPGESVFLKAGASSEEPVAVTDEAGYLRMNIDKGHQSEGGKNARVVGNIANTSRDCLNLRYEFKDFGAQDDALEVTTDASGSLWAIVGTDSGFEATTSIYYTRVTVRVREVEAREG